MTTPQILNAAHVKVNNNLTLLNIAEGIFSPLNNNTNNQLSNCKMVIEKNYGKQTSVAKPVVNLVYQKMQKIIGEEINKGQIPFGAESEQSHMLLQSQEYLLNDLNTGEEKRFDLQMDRVLTLRMQGKLEQALSELRSISKENIINAPYAGKWECRLVNEIKLKNKEITNREFVQLVASCVSPTKQKEKPTIEQTNSEDNETVSNLTEITVYPNPSSEEITVHWSKELYPKTITVYDSKGNEVYRKVLDEATLTTITIPTQKLEIGMYFVKMDTPEHSRFLKFAVLR